MSGQSQNLAHYANCFRALNVSRNRINGTALYKPILLLCVIEMIANQLITENKIFITPELVATFSEYRRLLSSDFYQAELAQPYFYMSSEKFWHIQAMPGLEEIVSARKIQPKSLKDLRTIIQYAWLDEELFEILQQESGRAALIAVLAAKWFDQKQSEMKQLIQRQPFQELQIRLMESGGAMYRPEDLKSEDEVFVRDAAFRRVVISVYGCRCALCRLRVSSVVGQQIVDGAHIKPFARFYDNQINNGLSLCKNHHWAFDRGWFGIADDFKILVSKSLYEESPHGKTLQQFQGETLLLPDQAHHLPRTEALFWHRENTFIA